MYTIPLTSTTVPGEVIDRRPSGERPGEPSAWLGGWETVRLDSPLQALRVHVGGGVGAVTWDNVHLAKGAGPLGARGPEGTWFAIGDFVLSYDDFISSRALPLTQTTSGRRSFFTEAVIATLLPRSILNVGRASGLFGHAGGGEQAEFLEGPNPILAPIGGSWSREYGRA